MKSNFFKIFDKFINFKVKVFKLKQKILKTFQSEKLKT